MEQSTKVTDSSISRLLERYNHYVLVMSDLVKSTNDASLVRATYGLTPLLNETKHTVRNLQARVAALEAEVQELKNVSTPAGKGDWAVNKEWDGTEFDNLDFSSPAVPEERRVENEAVVGLLVRHGVRRLRDGTASEQPALASATHLELEGLVVSLGAILAANDSALRRVAAHAIHHADKLQRLEDNMNTRKTVQDKDNETKSDVSATGDKESR